MGIIKQKHEQKSDKWDISRMSRMVVMTRELVRILVIAVATMVCVGGYKDISAAAESNVRADWQRKVDQYAEQVDRLCTAGKEQRGFLAVVEGAYEGDSMLMGYLKQQRNRAFEKGLLSIVKQFNGLIRKMYECMADALVYALTRRLTVQGSDNERLEVRDKLGNRGGISFIPEEYIRALDQAKRVGSDTFNFNLEREMREGIARDMNAAILRAVHTYNNALTAEGDDAWVKFGIQLSSEQIEALQSMIAPRKEGVERPPVGQESYAQLPELEFQRRLQQEDPDLYNTYKDILTRINQVRWGALYVATLEPRKEELLLFTRAGEEVLLDYVFGALKALPQNMDKQIDALATEKKFGVYDRLNRVRVMAKQNIAIWKQAIGLQQPAPQQQEQSAAARTFLGEKAQLLALVEAIKEYPTAVFPGHVYQEIVRLEKEFENAIKGLADEDFEDDAVRSKLQEYQQIKERDIEPIRQAEQARIAQERAARSERFTGTTPTPISGGGAPPSGVSQRESGLARMEREEREERQQLLVEARTLVDDLSRAVEKAKLVTGNVRIMQAAHGKLREKYDAANRDLQNLETISRARNDDDLLQGVKTLSAHSAFRSALEQMRRITAAIQKQQEQEEASRAQRTATTIPISGGGVPTSGVSQPEPARVPEEKVGDLLPLEFKVRFEDAEKLVNRLREAVKQAKSATQNEQDMQNNLAELALAESAASLNLAALLTATGFDERVLKLRNDPAFADAIREMERIRIALQTYREQQQLQSRSVGSPVVGGGAGAAPLPEPQIEPTVATLPQSEYESRLDEVRGLIKDVYKALRESNKVSTLDINAMEAMLKDLHTKERLAYETAKTLVNESNNAPEAVALSRNEIFFVNGPVDKQERAFRRIIDRVKRQQPRQAEQRSEQ